MTTPIEQAQTALDALQVEVRDLEAAQHQLDRDRAAARQAGETAEADRINAEFGQSNLAIRLAQGRLADSREKLASEQQRLRQARDRAAEAVRAAGRLTTEIDLLQERLHLLVSEHERAQQAAREAETTLAALQPPEAPTAPPEPVVEADLPPVPEFERYTSAIHSRGEPSRYFAADGREVDASGRPLDVQPEPAPVTRRRKKGDEDKVTTAPSLFD